MKNQTYSEQYKHPMWQKKRLKIMERDNFTCMECGETDKTLNVHHTIYYSDKKIWQYDDKELITLCSDCHKYISETKADIRHIIDKSFINGDILSEVHGLLVDISNFNPWQIMMISKNIKDVLKKESKKINAK